MEILRKIRLNKKHLGISSDYEALMRLDALEDRLSGANKVENVLWHDRAYKDRK